MVYLFRKLNPMKIFIKILVCSIAFFHSSYVFSQTDSLSTTRIILTDSSFVGATDSILVTVKNVSGTTFSGNISINYMSTLGPFSLCPTTSYTLNTTDTVQVTCNITFDTSNGGFNSGNNIVVVWSSGNALAPYDSLQENVYLKLPMAISENIISGFRIYPTISTNFISVEPVAGVIPKKIFITDLSGRIVKIITPELEHRVRIRINTSELTNGIYFLDILLPDKQRIVSKFLKE